MRAETRDRGDCCIARAHTCSFVFFCGHGLTQTKIKAGLTKAFTALRMVRKTLRTSPLHFLDGNKIAAWTNRHLAAVAYVAKCCRHPAASDYRT